MSASVTDPASAGYPRRCAWPRRTVRLVAATVVLGAALAATPLMRALPEPRHAGTRRRLARALLRALGVRHELRGRVPHRGALVVCGRGSWLDMLVLTAHLPVRLVVVREPARWPDAVATAWGVVRLDPSRPRALPGTVAAVTRLLRVGGFVAAFPAAAGGFRPALFQSAIDAGAPVSPAAVTVPEAPPGGLLATLRQVSAVRTPLARAVAYPAIHPEAGADRQHLARVAYACLAPAGRAEPHVPRRSDRPRTGPLPARTVSPRPPNRYAA